MIALGKDLRWIQFWTAGIERGIRFGMPRGIPVCAAPGVKGPTVAEHAMLLLLASFRRFRDIEQARGRRDWIRDQMHETSRTLEDERSVGAFDVEGHAYDISEGGIRFELDRPLPPGTRVAMQITLPSINRDDIGPGRSILVFANIVWLDEDDSVGPHRMAAVFTHFARAGDRDRLLRQFATGRFRAAA